MGSMLSQTITALKDKATSSPNSRFGKFIKGNSITLRNVVVALSTYGLEELVNAKAFNCPEESYKIYGFAFLILPVIVLFCANLVIIGDMGALTTRIFVKRYQRRGKCLTMVMPSLLKASVGPIMWLIAAFRNDDYYLCAKLGPSPVPNNATVSNETSFQQIMLWEKNVKQCKSESHVIALSLLVAFVFVTAIAIVCKECCVKDKFLMPNHFAFEKREALSAMQEFLNQVGGPNLKEHDLEATKGKEEEKKKKEDKAKEGSSIEERTGEVDNASKAEETDCSRKSIEIKGSDGEKCILYPNGVPEVLGRETVKNLFKGFSKDDWKVNSEWHYVKAYAAFKQMYPRITTGNPLDPWRKLEGDRSCSQKSCKTVARLFQPHQQQGKKDEDRTQQLKPVFYGANVNQVHLNGNDASTIAEESLKTVPKHHDAGTSDGSGRVQQVTKKNPEDDALKTVGLPPSSKFTKSKRERGEHVQQMHPLTAEDDSGE